MPATIHDIITRAKRYLPSLQEDRVMRAYHFAEEAHRGQVRFSGEPYIHHPLNVAASLLDFHPDEESLITALLHDVAEDTERSLDDIEATFGSSVREVCSGLVKLSKVRSKLNDPHVENLRKLFLAMAKDFRVVLIKLCDRLHNMRTLEFVRPEKRIRIAQETLNIYAPIAARLGIYRLKSQLEDLAFKWLQPEEYRTIDGQLMKTGKLRDQYIEAAKKILQEIFAQEGVQAEIDGRVKSMYSICRKLQKKNKLSIDEVFDIFAMRIIIPDIYKHEKEYTGHLYAALGILHNHFTPLANRFKDYVAVPKVNGYRSLHTTVMGLGPKEHTQPTEVQLRTCSMHQAAEFGIAAHWLYKEETIANSSLPLLQQHQEWMSGLGKIEQKIKSNQELLENLRVDIFSDRIFVLTPRGDVKDLPSFATPVDFAYSVHTEIGNHCIGAKVNGIIMPLEYELKSGEVVEIITRKNAKPSLHWLSFLKTNHARDSIRSWFHQFDEEKHLSIGKMLLNKKLQQLGKPVLDDSLTLLRHYDGENLGVAQRKQLLVELGKGAIFTSTILKKLFTLEELIIERGALHEHTHRSLKVTKPRTISESPRLLIGNEMDVPYHFVKCCSAMLNDELIGYTTRGRGVSIHTKKCRVAVASEKSRLIDVRRVSRSQQYQVRIVIVSADRIGLMRDISHVIAENGLNIVNVVQEQSGKGCLTISVIIDIEQFDQLDRLLSQLGKIPSVRRAVRAN